MTTHSRKLLPLCIAAALLSTRAAAVGVGDIQLASYLGKPLQAEVALNDTGDLSADQIRVRVGSEADYQAMGVEYSYLHSQLKIEPFLRNGRGYVRISTHEPISEPYLNFVLTVQWPQGQVVREFTVLLDPAPIALAAAAPLPKPAAVAATPRSADSIDEPAPVARRRVKPAVGQVQDGAYVVQRGDSLWRIASRMQTGDASLAQAMNAIVARNPQAFINGDPGRLKEAARIVMPTAEEIAVGGSAPVTAPTPVATAAAPTPAAAPAELVEENALLKTQVAELSGSVTALNESLSESEQRLHQLEAQLDGVLQQIQQQRASMAALSDDSQQRATSSAVAGGSMINQVNASELTPVARAHTPWWVHLLYWLSIGGVATWAIREHFWPQRRLAALQVAGGEAPIASAPLREVRSSAPALQRHDWSADTLDDVAAAVDLEQPAALPVADDTPPALVVNPGDDAVDASISAGVFVAFGRYDEAERLLRDALRNAPARTDLKLQLLDVYAQADRPEAFEALAQEIEKGPVTAEIVAELAVLRDSYNPNRR